MRREVRPAVGWMLTAAMSGAVVGCARNPTTTPEPDRLVEWLMTSETARGIAAAAVNHSWLTEAPGEVDDLRAVMRATDVLDVESIERTLAPALDEVRSLLGALRQERPGSTRGDLAHWVAVALLAFAPREPDLDAMPTGRWWDADYLEQILELRPRAAAETLDEVERPPLLEIEPPPAGLIFRPHNWAPWPMVALRAEAGWPLFASPGSQTLAGAMLLRPDELLRGDDVRWALRVPGSARVRVDYVRTVGAYALRDDGTLEFAGSTVLALRQGQRIPVLAQRRGGNRLWAWLGDRRLVALRTDCCHDVEPPDLMPWMRLREGLNAGKWVMLPESSFRRATREDLDVAAGRGADPADRGLFPVYGDLGGGPTAEVDVGDAALKVFRSGIGVGEPLFVVPGQPGLGSSYLRPALTSTVGPGRQLLTYDPRGTGESTGADDPARITFEQAVEDLEALRAASGLPQIDVLGHAFGGLVATRYAARYPERVRKLILVEAEPAAHAEWAELQARVDARRTDRDRHEIGVFESRLHERALVALQVAVLGLRARAWVVDPAHAGAMDFGVRDETLRSWTGVRDALRASMGAWDHYDTLAGIRAPTLIVAGDHGVQQEATQRLAAGISGSRLVVLDGVGHFPFVEAPQRFGEAVFAFLRPSR